MKRICINKFGFNQEFPLVDFSIPEPINDTLIIEHEMMGFNPVDYKIVEGENLISRHVKDNFPWTPGFDICGRVIKIGPNCQKFKIGERVCGMLGFPFLGGGYATHSVAREDQLVLVPESMNAKLALTCCLSGLTALEAYESIRNSNKPILILGATGGVGFSLINITKYFGRHTFGTFRDLQGLKYLSCYESITPISIEDINLFFDNNMEIDLIDLVGGEFMLTLMKQHKDKIKNIITVPSYSASAILEAATRWNIHAVTFIVKKSVERMIELIEIKNHNRLQLEASGTFHLNKISDVFKTYQRRDFKGKIFLNPRNK